MIRAEILIIKKTQKIINTENYCLDNIMGLDNGQHENTRKYMNIHDHST